MDCKGVQEGLSLSIDHELDEKEEAMIREHLAACQTCRSDYGRFVRGWEALGFWEDQPPPVYLRDTIVAVINHNKRKKKVAIGLSAAAVLLIAIGILFIQRDMRGQGQNIPLRILSPRIQGVDAAKDINVEDVIANLDILQEKDFYDILDALEKIDYLPLVDETGGRDAGKEGSSLEIVSV